MRPVMKRAMGAGVIAGIAYALWRAWRARVPQGPREIEWASAPFPFPPVPRPPTPTATAAPAVTPAPAAPELPVAQASSADPNPDGSCPVGFPVKGKRASGIYHVEGGANYERTRADRCYADERAAQSDGLRRSKV